MPAAVVTVVANQNRYATHEKIVITISNGLKEPITTADQQTYCSVIILERQGEGDWQPVRNCTLNSPSLEVTVKPGSVAPFELAPNQISSGSIPPGTYRATLIYTIGEHFGPGQARIVSSEPFTVR